MIWLLVKYILTAAVKDRLLLGLLGLVVVGVSLSIFLGSSAITEKDQFSLVFASGGLRFGGLITLVLFTVFYVRRSFETRDVEYLLARPISHLQFLSAHFIALSVLAALISIIITLTLFFMPSESIGDSLIIWGISLFVEYIIIANIALFFSFMLSSAVSASLMSFAFYVLARLIGSILAIIEAGDANGVMMQLAEKVMLLISIFIPRLDLMGQTSWLVYGVGGLDDLIFLLLQGSIFCGFIFAVTLWDLKHKQF